MIRPRRSRFRHATPALRAAGALAALAAPALAHAGEAAAPLIGAVRPGSEDGVLAVELILLNSEGQARAVEVPARLPVTLTLGGERRSLTLECSPDAAAPQVEAGGFARRECLLRLPEGVSAQDSALLSLGGDLAGSSYAFALPAAPAAPAPAQMAGGAEEPPALAAAPAPAAKPDDGNAFLGNLSAYSPIYAVYGPGTNSDGRIQISFKYQLFGDAGDVGGNAPIINGLHFAYTQRLLWDLGAESSPFRNVDYMPEIFYLQPAVEVAPRLALGGQIGFRHESNGRDGAASRSANTIYVQPIATMKSGDLSISLAPRLFFYVGDREDNPDIRRYRGNTGLFAEIGRDEGFRLTANSRFNFSTGKGSVDAELSYPLDRIVDTPLNLYLFGQAFAGYGENLLDYNRQQTRLRFGFAIVR
ncbi:phospholipase [Altererythrobacter sp. B11]|uniref:phospholipase A n=1 Tax=Altererythrobacter sp. B11 TaxID=2060312 RepID=UPI000DC7293F|nr:phospholipase A [Altererythrobacter sp. B11]BBC73453.1 phospholipase [Altererythrobacter sp. B11]